MRWFVLTGLIACSNKESEDPKTKDPSNGDDDDDTTPVTTADTGEVVEVEFSDPSYRLHDDIDSLAYAVWTQTAEAELHVEYSFDLDDLGEPIWLSSPSRLFPEGTNEQLLVGIPYETEASWRLVDASGAVVLEPAERILTGQRPDVPEADLIVSEPDRWLAGAEWLLTSINSNDGGWTGGTYWSIILDRKGRLVWALRTPNEAWTLFTQVAVTGDHILWDEQRYWSEFGEGEQSKVHKGWLDAPIEIIDTPGLHHAFVQLPDETLVWGSQAHGGGEALVEKAPGQPDETVIWTCTDDWPQGGGWCESNGIFYVEATDSFLYSFYTNSSIVEVDHATGESLWWAGDASGGWSFDPPDSDFQWQHGISYTDSGTLLVSSEYDSPVHTWLLEYEVDAANETLTLVWSSDSGTRADTNGQAWRLDNGNTLHIVGSAGVAREVDAGGQDVWRVDFNDDYLLGHGQLLTDLYALTSPVE